MPKGFPISHPRFLVNSVLPIVGALICIICIVGSVKKNQAIIKLGVLCLTVATASAAITGKILFPTSIRLILLVVPFGLFVILAFLTFFVFLRFTESRISRTAFLSCVILSLLVGSSFVWPQKSDDPFTTPVNCAFPSYDFKRHHEETLTLPLIKGVSLNPKRSMISISNEKATLEVFPVLSFISRSPDRFWTIFAPRRQRSSPSRSIIGSLSEQNRVAISYTDDSSHILDLKTLEEGASVAIASFSKLIKPVYSHLNSYCELQVKAEQKLWITFSPCPENEIEIKKYQFPFGAPARLAYLDSNGIFKVVEADNSEKGPFKILAEGDLQANDELRVVLKSSEEDIFSITLHDWASQCSTNLSPTAGWGLPENAIEFSLNQYDNTIAHVFITLAGTSVGRGWDSVGHCEGVYRNRLSIDY